MTDQTVKPCPFCGGEASFFETHSRHWTIACTKCAVTHPFVAVREVDPRPSLITAWNHRTPDHLAEIAALRAERDALREALEALRLQALQSPDLLVTEWGQDALALAHGALTTGGQADAV